MPKPVLSTYKILKEKAFNSDIDESWIEWAMEMMQAGYESDSLYELAGISKPYNQFELQVLAERVLKELELDYSNKLKVLKNYVYFLIISNIDEPENYYRVLKELKDIHLELEVSTEFQNFAFLYWAKEDLMYSDFQHYWEGADKTNMDKIIKEQFQLYISRLDQEKI